MPTTSKMPFSKKSMHSTESQFIAKYDLISVEANNVIVDKNDNENEAKALTNYNYILKEKSTNNNDVETAFENGNWHYDSNDVGQLKISGGGDFLNIKSFEAHEYSTKGYCDEDGSMFLQQKNKRKLRTNSSECVENVHYNIIQNPVGEIDNVEENVNSLNSYEEAKIIQKHGTLNEKDELSHRHIKLPVTPTKCKGMYKNRIWYMNILLHHF